MRTPARVLLGTIVLFAATPAFAVQQEVTPQQMEKLLKRVPEADANKDGKLTLDEFIRTFPARQISAYKLDWGADKKMYITQWGTHADRNTPLQGPKMPTRSSVPKERW